MNKRLFGVSVLAAFASVMVGWQATNTVYYINDLAFSPSSLHDKGRVLGAVTTSGLAVYFPFESLSAPEEGGFLFSADLKPSAVISGQAEGKLGKAATFNGNYTQKIVFKRTIQDDFSICAWIKTDSRGGSPEHYHSSAIVTAEWPRTGLDFGLGVDGEGKLAFGIGGASADTTIRSTGRVDNNTWQHFCATREKASGNLNLYINGSLQSSGTGQKDSLNANSNITIGDKDDSPRNPYRGAIDEFRIYSRILSDSEILSVYSYDGATVLAPVPASPAATTTPAQENSNTQVTASNLQATQLVNNRSLIVSVKPIEFLNNFWNYSLEWQRTLNRPGSVYINGKAVSISASAQGSATFSGIAPLSRNKMEFYSLPNGKGILLARKYFSSPTSVGGQTAQGNSVSCPAPVKNSFVGCFYSNKNLNNFLLSRTTSAVDFNWGASSPSAGVPVDNFSARWQGMFDFENAEYEFFVIADDGFKLLIDGQQITSQWKDQSPAAYSVSHSLTAGQKTVTLEYYEASGSAQVKLSWAKKVAQAPPPAPLPDSVINLPPAPVTPAPSNPPAGNGIVIKNFSGQTQTGRTFTISRVFARGEIRNFPQARIAGSGVSTQADVMTRYEDGSVKHVMVSFVANLPGSGSLAVDFVNQTSCRCGEQLALTKDQMLSSTYNFNAEIEASKDGAVQKANARTMLSNGDFRYWLKGEIVTQVIIEDRSQSVKYDFGFKNKGSFLASPNGYFWNTDTNLEVLDASDIPVPSVVQIKNEKIRVCGKQGNILQIGASSCPNKDGRGFENTSANSVVAWGEVGKVVSSQLGWRAADSGQYKALHPIFVATFTPKTPQSTKVEMILENAWTQKLQDQYYDVTLKAGSSLPAVYSAQNVQHKSMTRWRKVFYSGQTPGTILVDYNFPYMAYSKAMPNYNTTIQVSDSAINDLLVNGYPLPNGFAPGWRNSDKGDLKSQGIGSSHGQLQKDQFVTGGRPELGLFPLWQIMYLYTMNRNDSRALEIYDSVVGNAEAGMHFPFFLRESKTGKAFVQGRGEDMFGRPLSLDARPLTYSALGKSADEGGDNKFMVDAVYAPGWNYDTPHEVSFFYVPYILTGDWYYLEGMYGMASYSLSRGNVGYRGRGIGFIHGEDRNTAWSLRTLAHAASSAPDNSAEKKYYTDKLNNNIAGREGTFNITNGSFYSACTSNPYNINTEMSPWCFGKNTHGTFPNPLYYFSPGGPVEAEGDPSKAAMVFTPFMYSYLTMSFGHIEELGFSQIRPYREKFGQNMLGQMLDPGYSPYYLHNYRAPSMDSQRNYFTNWTDAKNAMHPQYQTRTTEFIGDHDYDHGYPILAWAASSYLADFTYQGKSGRTAWEFFRQKIRNQQNFANNPKWAILPR